MARTELDRAVQPSLLDRLTDDDPSALADTATTRETSARAFRLGVQRDVEWLLNTRRTMVRVSEEFPEVLNSVHEYGLPDSSGLEYASVEGRDRLTDEIADTLRRFEPRMTNVAVKLLDASALKAPQLRFSIEATLLMDPNPEQIVFDTVLEIASGTYEVDDKN